MLWKFFMCSPVLLRFEFSVLVLVFALGIFVLVFALGILVIVSINFNETIGQNTL
jgi:hypothetical protein